MAFQVAAGPAWSAINLPASGQINYAVPDKRTMKPLLLTTQVTTRAMQQHCTFTRIENYEERLLLLLLLSILYIFEICQGPAGPFHARGVLDGFQKWLLLSAIRRKGGSQQDSRDLVVSISQQGLRDSTFDVRFGIPLQHHRSTSFYSRSTISLSLFWLSAKGFEPLYRPFLGFSLKPNLHIISRVPPTCSSLGSPAIPHPPSDLHL
ncbi:hypothetical protein BGZ60DRAFT_13100 [Tricladium varicosporioides]|nr:hypothetical protein BGZ60DRAFT_13100 [Hymenoscyphus varicosporioides]